MISDFGFRILSNGPLTPKMGLEETLALTPARVGLVFHRDFVRSPRRGGKRAQFPEFSRPLVWYCVMGTYVGCYEASFRLAHEHEVADLRLHGA